MDKKEEIKKTIEEHLSKKGITKEDINKIQKNSCKLPPRKLNLIIKT